MKIKIRKQPDPSHQWELVIEGESFAVNDGQTDAAASLLRSIESKIRECIKKSRAHLTAQ